MASPLIYKHPTRLSSSVYPLEMEGLEKLAPEIMPRTAYALPMRATSIAPAPAPAIPWEQKLHTL